MKMLRLIGAACAFACALALTAVLTVARFGRHAAAIAGAILFVILLPGLAAAADTPATTLGTTIDFGPVLHDVVLPIALAILPIVAAWVASKVNGWLGIQNNAALSGLIETAMQNGLALAQSKVPNLVPTAIPVDVKNELIATAANYVLAHVPDALKMLGVDQGALIQKLEARLAVNTTPAEQSVAVPTSPASVRS